MQKISAYIKNNPFLVILIVLLLYLSYREQSGNSLLQMGMGRGYFNESMGVAKSSMTLDAPYSADSRSISPVSNVAPVISPTRLTVYDTNLFMQVKDVKSTVSSIEALATQAGGYLISNSLSQPELAATGEATIRIPIEKKSEVLASIRALGIKVVNESSTGYDVTDQYSDLETRLSTLKKTYSKFSSMLDEAKNVQDTLEVQRELVNLQVQIDNIIGQQKYLDATAKLTRISISLATDELALPYAPDQAWRPAVIFKSAVRSLLLSLRSLGSGVIWLIVYSPIWATALVGYLLYRRSHKS